MQLRESLTRRQCHSTCHAVPCTSRHIPLRFRPSASLSDVKLQEDVCNLPSRELGLGPKVLSACLSAAMATQLNIACAQAASYDVPVYDGAKIVPDQEEIILTKQLQEFERDNGFKVRVFTSYGPLTSTMEKDIRSSWSPDKNTVIVQFDPSSPNIMSYPYLGDNVLQKLRRPWWIELQSRYGNLFYVRDEGEQATVMNSMSAVTTCLGKPEGCQVVPGLSSDHYFFTLGLSVVAGVIAGFVSKLEPAGFVQRKWVWLLIFSPLWASVFINFGLGPVITRTDDPVPVIANTVAFAATVGVFYLIPKVLGPQLNPPSGDQGGQ